MLFFLLLHVLAVLSPFHYITIVGAAPRPTPRPLVIWHGLGDSAHAKGMLEFIEMMKEMHPGLFVHSVYISEKEDDDRKAGFVRLYLLDVCATRR